MVDFIQTFDGCSSLEVFFDMSLWKIDNVINMEGLFAGYSLLKYLPDISK